MSLKPPAVIEFGNLLGRGRALIASLGRPGRSAAVRGELVGVDLGGSSIKLTRMRRGKGRPQLLDFAELALPPAEAFAKESRTGALKEGLAELVRTHRLKGKQAVGLVYGLDVVLRRTIMPSMPHADLHSALELEAHKYVPFPPDRIALDYEVIGPTADAGQVEVLVAACDRERLAEIYEILSSAGLKVRGITVPPLAFRNVMRHTSLAGSQEVTAFFDVGHHSINLCIFKRDELRFSRELSLGSHAFTEALRTIIVPGQGTIKLTEEEAERLKLEHGIPMGEDEKKIVGGIALANVTVMLRPTLERLTREIWSSFDYCNEEFFGESVQRVFLTGRGARLKNLPAYLESVLRVPVSLFDVGTEFGISGERTAGELDGLGFAPALSLEDFAGINLERALLPAEVAPIRVVAGYLTVPRMATAALLAVAVDASLLELHHNGVQQRLSAMEAAQARMTQEAPELTRIQSRMKASQNRAAIRAQLSMGSPDWSLVLKDLSLRIGPRVRLREIRPEMTHPDQASQPGALPEQRLLLDGNVDKWVDRPELEVASTMRSLMASAFFSDVRLVESSPSDSNGTRVVISCALRGGQ